MPQKVNPIDCEGIIGLAGVAGALVSAAQQAMQHGHERAAGQWQIEWQIIPQVAHLAASAVSVSAGLVANLQVFPEVMKQNLRQDGGLVMAEAYMIRLAEQIGQSAAHDLVYTASQQARLKGQSLEEAIKHVDTVEVIAPEQYLGQASAVCAAVLEEWRKN